MPNEQQQKRAVIYCRVSTKEQVDEGNSLATQERHCREYALKNKYDIAEIFIEQGESAKTIDRTALKKLMAFCALKKNNVSAVIAYKIDRISRNTDDYSQIRILMKRYGVEIKSTSEHFEDTPAGRFMENIIANVAQFDNDVRAERSTGGMKDAVREGRYVWMAPLGYSNVRVDGKATIAANSFATFILKAFEEVSLNQYPIDEVRKMMATKGLVTPLGKPISKSHFYRVLRNELYNGWINKFGERHRGNFTPIVSDVLYSKVQSILSSKIKSPFVRVSDNPDFPLRRFFKHTNGKLLTGCWSQGKKKKYPYCLIHNTGINIRKEELENVFKNWLNQYKIDIEYFDKLYMFTNKKLQEKYGDKRNERLYFEDKIIALKAKQNLILNKNISGIIDDNFCKEKLDELNVQIFDISKTLAELPKSKIENTDIMNMVKNVLMQPDEIWARADLEVKIRLQWFYFPEGITIDNNGSRTSKICKLFKLKESILAHLSSNVHHPNIKSNMDNWQVLTVDDNSEKNKNNLIEEIIEEVKELERIFENKTINNN